MNGLLATTCYDSIVSARLLNNEAAGAASSSQY